LNNSLQQKPERSGTGAAIGLFFLAPLVAEFLLGNLPIKLLPALIMLAPMYGGGALLIRETVRRIGRGWPSILLLSLTYGIVEEAAATQSLFNPDYLGMHMGLLKPAYILAFGMGGWWTIFVLNLHTVWSIATPIALIEGMTPERSKAPWLGRVGLAVICVIFAAGAVAMTLMSYRHDRYMSSPAQFAGAAIACVTLVIAALKLPRWEQGREAGAVPSPWVVGALALAAGSAFLLIPNRWGWWAAAAIAGIDLVAGGAVWFWSRKAAWNQRHAVALASGAALAYAWHAFIETPIMASGVVTRIGNAIFAAGAVVVIWIAANRTSRVAVEAQANKRREEIYPIIQLHG